MRHLSRTAALLLLLWTPSRLTGEAATQENSGAAVDPGRAEWIGGFPESLPPGSRIEEFLFFESERDAPAPYGSRDYREHFAKQSRTIYWELRLSYPAAARPYQFDIQSIMYKDGVPFREFGIADQTIKTGWTNSWYSTGWGLDDGWSPGYYQIGLMVDNVVVVVDNFVVLGQSVEEGSDRPGSDYANFNLPSPDYGLCERACNNDGRCQAWTYVRPGVQGPTARCWLKTAVPPARANQCCVSGTKSAGGTPLAGGTPSAGGTPLAGGNPSAGGSTPWRFVGVEYNTGPLDCNIPTELLDWAAAPSDGVEGQPYARAVKYQRGNRGRVEHMSIHAWTDPVLKANGTWVIYLTSSAILGNPGPVGIVAYLQRTDETNPLAGPEKANSRLIGPSGGAGRQAQAAVTLSPSDLRFWRPNSFKVHFIASNGGQCSERHLADFHFAR